jgi:hypothetical protein
MLVFAGGRLPGGLSRLAWLCAAGAAFLGGRGW